MNLPVSLPDYDYAGILIVISNLDHDYARLLIMTPSLFDHTYAHENIIVHVNSESIMKVESSFKCDLVQQKGVTGPKHVFTIHMVRG